MQGPARPSQRLRRFESILDNAILFCLCAGCLGLAVGVVWAVIVL